MGPKSAHREGQKNALDLYNVEIDITLIVFSVGGGGKQALWDTYRIKQELWDIYC